MLGLVLVAGMLFTGCSGQDGQGSPQSQMNAWVNGTGFGPTLGTLENDVKRSTQTLTTGGTINEAHTVCAVLLLDVQRANGNLPTPDELSTQLLSDAYASLGKAAHDCYSAVGNPTKMASYSRNKNQGLSLLSQAQAKISSVLGASFSTSTTIDNGSTAQ